MLMILKILTKPRFSETVWLHRHGAMLASLTSSTSQQSPSCISLKTII